MKLFTYIGGSDACFHVVTDQAEPPAQFRKLDDVTWQYMPPDGTAKQYAAQQGVIALLADGFEYSEALDDQVNDNLTN